MVDIEQVRLLEQRVQKVIARIGELQAENRELREQTGVDRDRIAELERRIESFSTNQEEIERGILNALHQLDEVEDAVTEDGESRTVPEVAGRQDDDTEEPPTEIADEVNEPAPVQREEATASSDIVEKDALPSADEAPMTQMTGEQVAAVTANDPSTEETEGDEEPGPELDIF